MNRYDVYDFATKTFMFVGIAPTEKEIVDKFKDKMPAEEIAEGIIEFEMRLARWNVLAN